MADDDTGNAREIALRRLKAKRAFKSLLITAAGLLVLMVVIWALSGGGYFWPIWVVFGLGIALVTTGWQAYGSTTGPITEDEIQDEMGKLK